MQLSLDFLQYQRELRVSTGADGKKRVFDPIRRKDIVLTPEELLRQLTLHYLLQYKQYPSHRLRVEFGLEVNGLRKRCDIVVFDQQVQPWLLVECKSPKVALNEKTFGQVAAYNIPFQAPYLAVTNGLSTFCCALDHQQGSFTFLEDFPSL